MKKFYYINKILLKIRGESLIIDQDVPFLYFMGIIFSKMISLFWSMLRLKSFKRAFVHPSSTLKSTRHISYGKNFSIGRNCFIDALSRQGLVLGNNVSIGDYTYIRLTGSLRLLGQGMIVGNNVGLGTCGHYGSGAGLLIIGDDTIFGPHVTIVPENHVFDDVNRPIRLQGVKSSGGVVIGSNCWIGANVTILDGTRLGNRCIVAAGAVVKGEFPGNVIIGGVPAKIIKSI